jgi:signal transduction histidine kinase
VKRSSRMTWWGVYWAGSAVVLAALGWVTQRVLDLERVENEARVEIRRQELVRQALWRMDSWLAPRLAREAGRTWFEYESYYPQLMAFNRALEPLTAGEVVLPSPLLDFRSDLFPIHFQHRNGMGFSSPQVPAEVYRSQDLVGCSPVPHDPVLAQRLADLSASLNAAELRERAMIEEALVARMLEGEQKGAAWTATEPVSPPPQTMRQQSSKLSPEQWSKMQLEAADDLQARRNTGNSAQQQVSDYNTAVNIQAKLPDTEPGSASAQVGPLVPLWVGPRLDQLALVRRVRLNTEVILQGVLVDWPLLRTELLRLASETVPEAQLVPLRAGEEADPAVALASLPAVLLPPASLGSDMASTSSASLAGLGLMWLAALGALGTTGLALRSTIASAVQTSRFASSVTHELRTPLTTFRMYAEMLNDGMVTTDEQRRAYLTTLRDESARLGFLVENVLTWSRVEEGRAAVEPRPFTVEQLVQTTLPLLERRCEESGAKLEVSMGDSQAIASADADRVRQVLFNLVDNACKYAGHNATIRLCSQVGADAMVLAVEDDGPGVPAAMRRSIFQPFDRGARGPGDAIRGLGLGLAISRELARSLGGELRCTDSTLGGARFELSLPLLRASQAASEPRPHDASC